MKKKSPNMLVIIIKFNGLNLLFRIQKFQVCVFKSIYMLLKTRNLPKTRVKCQE